MTHKIIAIALMALLANAAAAQKPQTDSTAVKEAQEEKPEFVYPRAFVGVRGGANISDMVYTHDMVDRYKHFPQLQGMVGLFGHFQLGKSNFSLRPEVSFVGRADSLEWLDVRYRMKTHYMDLRLPIVYNFCQKKNRLSPYLMVVPQFNMAYGGKISYHADDFVDGVVADVTKADVHPYDFAMMFGAGLDYLVPTKRIPLLFSLEAGYNMGFVNTFAEREILNNPDVAEADRSIIANNFFGAKLWQEKRHSRGIEVAVRLAVPIDGSWKKPVEPAVVDAIQLQEIQYDTVYLRDTTVISDTVVVYRDREVPTTVYVQPEDGDGRGDKLNYIKKDCYSIKEIKSFLTLGIDISDKRLCLFNINFEFDGTAIAATTKDTLRDVAELLRDFPYININIYGHTDSIGTEEYNMDLSNRRAKAVMNYLKSQGVEEGRMTPTGYGEQYPCDTNATEEGRHNNRRVEIDLLNIGKLTKD